MPSRGLSPFGEDLQPSWTGTCSGRTVVAAAPSTAITTATTHAGRHQRGGACCLQAAEGRLIRRLVIDNARFEGGPAVLVALA